MVTKDKMQWLFIFIYLLVSFVTSAQKNEKIINHYINDNAIVYQIFTDENAKLVIYNIVTKDSLVFHKTFEKFDLTEKHFIAYDKVKRELLIASIDDFKVDVYNNVLNYYLLADKNMILISNESSINLYNVESKSSDYNPKIDFFSVSNDKNWIFSISEKGFISRYSVKNKKKEDVKGLNITNTKIVKSYWIENDFFIIGINNSKVNLIKIANNLTYSSKSIKNHDLNNESLFDVLNNTVVSTDSFLLSYLVDNEVNVSSKKVAVYHSNLYEDDNNFRNEKTEISKYYILDFENDKIINLSLKYKNYDFFVSWSGKIYGYASISNYEKHFNDLRLYSLNKSIELEYIDIVTGSPEMIFTPSKNNFILYKSKNSWKKFDELLGEKKSVYTLKQPSQDFSSLEYEFPTEKWYSLTNGTYILKSMKNIVLFNNDMDFLTNIISDTDDNFDIVTSSYFQKSNKLRWKNERVLNHNQLLFHKKSAFHEVESVLKRNGFRENEIIKNCNCKISQVKFSENFISYIKESYNESPSLYFLNFNKKNEKNIYQSNKWDKDVGSIKSEYINWSTSDLLPRGVIIRYPLNYNSNKSYPVIFNIYEQKYFFQNEYAAKNEESYVGFNWRDYIANDYFVIEPDIYYKTGEMGSVIMNYIKNTIAFLKDYNKSIDVNRMGIIGHSFGGCEVNHIITQIDDFKVGVTGASVSNFTATAFDINKSTFRNNSWKFFGVQHRIGSLIYTNPEIYIDSSPIFHSKEVTTPLLIWHGKKDHLINYQESISFFNSLDYYNKPVKLLLFENEGHTIENKESKKLLSTNILHWFDSYLK